MTCLNVAIVVFVIGGWIFMLSMGMIASIADKYREHPGKPPSEWK